MLNGCEKKETITFIDAAGSFCHWPHVYWVFIISPVHNWIKRRSGISLWCCSCSHHIAAIVLQCLFWVCPFLVLKSFRLALCCKAQSAVSSCSLPLRGACGWDVTGQVWMEVKLSSAHLCWDPCSAFITCPDLSLFCCWKDHYWWLQFPLGPREKFPSAISYWVTSMSIPR